MTGEAIRNPDPICQSGLILQLREFTDEELVGFAQNNSQEGRYLLSLYCRYRSLVESITISSQSQVMASTVWVQVRRRVDKFKVSEGKVLNWLTVLSADTLAQVLRGNQKLLTSPSDVNPVLLAYLDQCLQKLTPAQRFIVILYDVYQWPVAQIKSWMADQQWTLSATHIENFLKQARQGLLNALPLDLRSLYWGGPGEEDQLKMTLQGLEFDLELEREAFRQWYGQEGALLQTTAPMPQPLVWAGATLGLVVVGGFLGWQGINVLTESLGRRPAEVPVVATTEVTEKPPTPQVESPIQPPVVTKPTPESVATLPPSESLPPQVTPAPQAEIPAPKPTPLLPKKAEVQKKIPSEPPKAAVQATEVKAPTVWRRVIVVASDSLQVASLKKVLPGVFPKSCPQGSCFQAGAFRTQAGAEALATKLRSQGFEVELNNPAQE